MKLKFYKIALMQNNVTYVPGRSLIKNNIPHLVMAPAR